jgi:hypothetical protein
MENSAHSATLKFIRGAMLLGIERLELTDGKKLLYTWVEDVLRVTSEDAVCQAVITVAEADAFSQGHGGDYYLHAEFVGDRRRRVHKIHVHLSAQEQDFEPTPAERVADGIAQMIQEATRPLLARIAELEAKLEAKIDDKINEHWRDNH